MPRRARSGRTRSRRRQGKSRRTIRFTHVRPRQQPPRTDPSRSTGILPVDDYGQDARGTSATSDPIIGRSNNGKSAGAAADVHVRPTGYEQDAGAAVGPALTAADLDPPRDDRHRPGRHPTPTIATDRGPPPAAMAAQPSRRRRADWTRGPRRSDSPWDARPRRRSRKQLRRLPGSIGLSWATPQP